MRWLLLTLMIGCLAVSGAYASDQVKNQTFDGPASDGPGSGTPAGVRSDIPVLTSFEIGGPNLTDVFCTGLGWHAGIFWVSGGDFDGDLSNGNGDNGIYFYDESGNYLGGFPQPTQDVWGWRDSGYTGTHLMYGASDPHSGTIFYVNANTLAVEQEFAGCAFATCRAIGVDLFMGGFVQYKVTDYDGDIQTWLWGVGDPAGTPFGSCPNPSPRGYGFAYDNGNNVMWMTTSNVDIPGIVYALDPVTCAVLNQYDLQPESPRFGGAVMAETSHGCNLWTICQCDVDMLFGWGTGGNNPFACNGVAVEPATWGSIKARYDD